MNTPSCVLILGLARTGLSATAYALALGQKVYVYDDQGAKMTTCLQHYPQAQAFSKDMDLEGSMVIVASPGIPDKHPILSRGRAKNCVVINDLEWFVQVAKAPIVAITGTNGKSTVTTLMGQCLQDAGFQVAVGGNLGTPVLDLLQGPVPDYYVIEVSSFQLDRCPSWQAHVACLLNIAEDHLDRYLDFSAYTISKHHIFQGCQYAVLYNDDPRITAPAAKVIGFGAGTPLDDETFGIATIQGESWLSKGSIPIMPVREIKLMGEHQYLNLLAVLAVGDCLGIAHESMRRTIGAFTGLAHRCQWVGHYHGMDWINDSKATNVAAVCATLKGLRDKYASIIWIAGGQAKTDDWSALVEVAQKPVQQLIVLGQAAPSLAQALKLYVPVHVVSDMAQAVLKAALLAKPNGAVVLAPACASFDMFANFMERGEQFTHLVRAVA